MLQARRLYSFDVAEYALFLDYLQAFKSATPAALRIPEFKEVVLEAVLPAYRKGHKNFTRVIKDVDGSLDRFLASHPRSDSAYALAFRYKQLQDKYGIEIDKVESVIEERQKQTPARSKD